MVVLLLGSLLFPGERIAHTAEPANSTNLVQEIRHERVGDGAKVTLVTKAPVIYRVLNWQQGGVEVDLYDVLLGQYDAQTIKVGDGVVDQLEVSSYGQGKRTMARLLIRTPSPVTVDAQRDKDGLVLTLNQGGAPAVAKGGDKGGDIDTLIQQVQEHHPVAAGGEAVGSAAEPGAAEPGAGATAEVAAADNGREELIVSTVHFTGRKMSLDFQDASITSVLRLIADTAGINMVFGKDVDGKVTMQLKNIPWDQALDIVLKTNSLGMKKEGGVYRVAKLEALQQEEEQHMAVKRSKEKAEDLERAILSINYANAKELSGVIKELLSTRGKMDVDVRTNTIIVKDIRSVVEEAKQVVEHLDLATPQVSIEARIVEATTNFAKELGVQWGGHFKAGPTTGNPTGLDFPHTIGLVGTADSTNGFAVNLPTTKTATGGIGLTLGSLTNALFLDLRLSALEESGEAKVIASPRVTTLDNQEAIIKQGDEIPFQSTSANQGTQTQFKEALLQLKVTPHITSNKKVILNIVASKDTPDFANAVNGQPAISKQEASTQVLLANHETTVIGGIYSIIEEDADSRIPFLSRIPWAGNLFKNHKHKRDRKELLIFITPRIVDEGV